MGENLDVDIFTDFFSTNIQNNFLFVTRKETCSCVKMFTNKKNEKTTRNNEIS